MREGYATWVRAADVAVARLVDADGLTEAQRADALVAIEAVQARLDAARAAVLAPFDAARACEGDGARSTKAWLRWRCRMSAGRAGRAVADARLVRDVPALGAALADGRVHAEHLKVLGQARSTNPERFDADVEGLVGFAAGRFDDFCRRVAQWRTAADRDAAEGDARADAETRRAHLSVTWKGMRQLDALFDVVGGEIFDGELRRLEQVLFDADWADAKARVGAQATVADLARTAAQRRVDALVEMATRSASWRESMGRARPLVTVVVDHPTVTGAMLGSGIAITPGQLGSLWTAADVERVVFGARSRVLDVSVHQRVFAGATRRACEVRDLRCAHPSCDEPAPRCEVDHKTPYDGRNTIHTNGECLCRWHHRHKHRNDPHHRRPPPNGP